MSTWTNEKHEAARARCGAATAGPWAPWLDQDGADHMNGLLMVGNADAVIPDGSWWVEGIDVNPIAHTYTPEDREFIAHARTDLADALDEIERLRPALAATAPMTQGEKRSLLARRFWAALDEVCDPGELPLIDELDHREVKDFAAATEAMISAVRVMLTRRHAAVPRPTGSEGEVP